MIRNAKVTDNLNGTVTVSAKCMLTGQPHSVTVPTDGYNAWLEGTLIQRALPNTSTDDREFLVSGISPKGWKQTFGE